MGLTVKWCENLLVSWIVLKRFYFMFRNSFSVTLVFRIILDPPFSVEFWYAFCVPPPEARKFESLYVCVYIASRMIWKALIFFVLKQLCGKPKFIALKESKGDSR